MDKNKIVEFLNSNELSDIEELEYKEGTLVYRLFYDFDDAELASARAYANDECKEEAESEAWFEEFFLPYLNDLAIDNVGEILQDAIDEFGVNVQYVSYEADMENYEYVEFIAVFHNEGTSVEIEEVLDELNI